MGTVSSTLLGELLGGGGGGRPVKMIIKLGEL